MARLPQPGGDNGNWGNILNEYLSQALKVDGTLKDNAVTSAAIAPGAVTATEIAADTITAAQIHDESITETQLDLAVQAKLNASSTASDWNALINKPTIIAAGADQAAARTAIGAGTSNLAIGTTGTTAAAGNDSRLSDTRTPTDGSVTTTKIADSNVTLAKLSSAVQTSLGNADSASTAVTNLQKMVPSDYVITVNGTTYTATARPGTGLSTYSGTNFSTVFQSAINALTVNAPNAGTVGSGGGKIHITKGNYHFVNEVTINGWEGIPNTNGIPHSQLIIEGEGHQTVLLANTSGQHGIVVKNLCGFVLRDIRGYAGPNGKAWLYGASDGAQSQMSIWGGMLTNLFVESNSPTFAPIHLRNFFDIQGDRITTTSTASNGFVLENASSDTHFGNSHWTNIRSTAANNIAFKIFSSIQPYTMNLMSFSHLETISGDVAVYTSGVQALQFSFCDFEDMNTVFFFDGNTTAYPGTAYSRGITINAGYLSCHTGGTFFKMRGSTGALKIWANTYTGTDTTIKYIDDTTQFQPISEIHLKTDTNTYTNGQISFIDSHIIDLQGYGKMLWSNVGGLHNYDAKTTPTGADEIAIADSADSWRGKRLSLANLASLVSQSQVRVLDIGGYYPDSTFPAVNSDQYDLVKAVNIYKHITDMSAALTGTPSIGSRLTYELTDNSYFWSLTWGNKFEDAPGIKLPNQLIGGSVKMTIEFRWNAETSKWRPQSITNGKSAVTQLVDTNNNVILDTSPTASAGNYLQLKNDSGTNPGINAVGGSANIDINFVPKGTGRVKQGGSNLITAASTDTLTNKTLTSPTLTTPRMSSGTNIADTNGNELIIFPATVASAVNEITISNAATGGNPSIVASGGDTDINLSLTGKGSGVVLSGSNRIATVSRHLQTTAPTLGSVQSHHYIYMLQNAAAIPTLPTAVGQVATRYTFKNTTGSAININTTSSQTIDGVAAPYSLASMAKITLISDNTGWQSI